MIVLPVLDVRGGRAVHAAGGDRGRYEPLSRRFPFPDDPREAAGKIRETWGERPVYLADLDALGGAAPRVGLVEALAADGHRLRVDAAVTGAARARALLQAGAAEVVVGLETLASWEDLDAVVGQVGSGRTVVSLDVRDGVPHTPGWRSRGAGAPSSVEEAAEEAGRRGAGTLQLLDLDRVGSERGPNLSLVRRVGSAAPRARLAAGGGVRGEEDVRAAAAAGCVECLVATALYGGRLPPETVRRIEDPGR